VPVDHRKVGQPVAAALAALLVRACISFWVVTSELASLRNKLIHSLPLFRPSARSSMSLRFPRAPFSVLATTPRRGLSPSR
jgi:hypothetical protein